MHDYTIAIIGTGVVGSITAYTLITEKIPAHLLLVDVNTKKCSGEVLDLEDACALSGITTVKSGTVHDAAQADIIIITAGIAQKPGQTRQDLLATNSALIQKLMHDMGSVKQTSIIIVVTNPIDTLTLQIQEMGILPRNQIFGSGTFVDTLRLKNAIAQKFAINSRNIDTMVIGEHGDNQFVAWSQTHIDGKPIREIPSFTQHVLDELEESVRKKVYSIIDCKGSTAFGVATCVSAYCTAIINNTLACIPVSCYQKDTKVCMSMPVLLGKTGIQKQIPIVLDAQEQQKLDLCKQSLLKAHFSIYSKV